jgi:hypothetical protein
VSPQTTIKNCSSASHAFPPSDLADECLEKLVPRVPVVHLGPELPVVECGNNEVSAGQLVEMLPLVDQTERLLAVGLRTDVCLVALALSKMLDLPTLVLFDYDPSETPRASRLALGPAWQARKLRRVPLGRRATVNC